jgi:hypothetical protein
MDKIVQINDSVVRNELNELVRNSVEDTLGYDKFAKNKIK